MAQVDLYPALNRLGRDPNDMRRREFVGLIGGAAAFWSLTAKAQGKRPVIGYLHFATSKYQPAAASFLKGLGEAGFIEGRDFSIAYRWAEGHYDRLPAMASELVGLEVDLIAAFGPPLPKLPRPQPRRFPLCLKSAMTRLKPGWSRASRGLAEMLRG